MVNKKMDSTIAVTAPCLSSNNTKFHYFYYILFPQALLHTQRPRGCQVIATNFYPFYLFCCIENLARVDVLCLDKTGTITNEEMEIEKIHILGNTSKEKLDFALSSIAKYTDDDNVTIMAFINYYKDKNTNAQKPQRFISFSSEKKWSGAVLSDGTAIVMGAGEFILKDRYSLVSKEIEKIGGIYRVITVATAKGFDDEGNIIGEPEPVAAG